MNHELDPELSLSELIREMEAEAEREPLWKTNKLAAGLLVVAREIQALKAQITEKAIGED